MTQHYQQSPQTQGFQQRPTQQSIPVGQSQQRQSYAGQQGTQSLAGQQGGQFGQQGVGQQSIEFDEMLPNDLRTALHDFSRLKKSAEWAAEQIHQQAPQVGELSRVLEDVAEIADLNEKLIVRDSRYGPYMAEAFVEVSQHAIGEIEQQSQQLPVLGPVVNDLQRTVNSTTELLAGIGWPLGQIQGGQLQGNQFGQQGQPQTQFDQQTPTGSPY